jgi:hypothetical protein
VYGKMRLNSLKFFSFMFLKGAHHHPWFHLFFFFFSSPSLSRSRLEKKFTLMSMENPLSGPNKCSSWSKLYISEAELTWRAWTCATSKYIRSLHALNNLKFQVQFFCGTNLWSSLIYLATELHIIMTFFLGIRVLTQKK